jgi:hypothetical protein
MTPAEKRIKELIERWLTSIELHLQYSSLPDEAYWKIQSWPKHDRPTRWVLESAKQKASELKEVLESRHTMGDSKFAEALELTNFLANLVGAQHVDRFVPLAEPRDDKVMPAPPVTRPAQPVHTAPPTSDVPSWYAQAQKSQTSSPPTRTAATKIAAKTTVTPAPPKPEPVRSPPADPDATREMPKMRAQAPPPVIPEKAEQRKPITRPAAPSPAKSTSKASAPPSEVQQLVIGDAVRLLGWGRTWHELPDLIARMADRPPNAEIRKTLRAHRATIEKTAAAAPKK